MGAYSRDTLHYITLHGYTSRGIKGRNFAVEIFTNFAILVPTTKVSPCSHRANCGQHTGSCRGFTVFKKLEPRVEQTYSWRKSVGAGVTSLNFLIETPIAVPFVGEREPSWVLMDSRRRFDWVKKIYTMLNSWVVFLIGFPTNCTLAEWHHMHA